MAGLKAQRPDLRILVTGAGADDEMILKALAAGAKAMWMKPQVRMNLRLAIRIVNQGSVWGSAPRAFDVHRAGHDFAGQDLPCRPRDVYRPRKRSAWNCWWRDIQ